VWRADQHGAPAWPQPARHAHARHGAVRALDAADRAGGVGRKGCRGRDERRGGNLRRGVHAYLDQAFLPELRRSRPDAVLVMDNLRAHRPRRSGRCSTAPAPPTATCPPTRPTSILSSLPEPKRRPNCAGSRPELPPHCTRRSVPPSTPSPRRTQQSPSATAAMPVPDNLRSVLAPLDAQRQWANRLLDKDRSIVWEAA